MYHQAEQWKILHSTQTVFLLLSQVSEQAVFIFLYSVYWAVAYTSAW